MHFSITTYAPVPLTLSFILALFLHATFDSTFITFSIFSVLISSELKFAVKGPLLLAVHMSGGAHAWDQIRVSLRLCVWWRHFIRGMCTWTKCTYQLVRQVLIKLVISHPYLCSSNASISLQKLFFYYFFSPFPLITLSNA